MMTATATETYQDTNARALYLDLMKKCLSNTIYGEVENVPLQPNTFLKRKLVEFFGTFKLKICRQWKMDKEANEVGKSCSIVAHTMTGNKRLNNLQFCVEDVIVKGVPGDLIETGVWRGGSTIFMRAILKAYGITDRQVWVADSFQGLPPPDESKYPADKGDLYHTMDELRVSKEQVAANFEKYGLLDDQVKFLKGWFSETLPTAPIEKIAVARLDGDMYESTMDALKALYPKLSVGGYMIIDDYGAVPGCKKAVEDYRAEHNITDEIHVIDWTGVYWQRKS